MPDNGRNIIKGLYAIIDSTYVAPKDMGRVAQRLVEGGVALIQMRAKGIGAGEQLKAALAIRKATKGRAIFIVNDRVDIALISRADGVHLGQDDIAIKEARRLLGKRAIIGISTHDVREAKKAEEQGADYISFGPIFPTVTKKDAQSPKGAIKLKKIRASTDIPIVAIGGIKKENVAEVASAGANAVAIISDLLTSNDVKRRAESIVRLLAEKDETAS